MSLRAIAASLSISHEAVRKKLKGLEGKDQVSTNPEDRKLTASIIKNETVSTCSKPRKQRVSRALGDTVNRVSTQKTPSLSPTTGVNPSGIASGMLSDSKKRVFQEVLSEGDDLFAAIKEFLENHGVELYQIQVSGEAYQVTNGTQVIRFYLSHINKDDMKRYSENFKE